MKLLILGSSGLVGSNVLGQALATPRVSQVIAPTRAPLSAHAKLVNPVAPTLEQLLHDDSLFAVDAIVCALGTTIAKAGSKEAFRQVDYVLPLAFARRAFDSGCKTLALVTAIGAASDSRFFYAQVKGELERDVRKIGFASLTIARPSIIGGERPEHRRAEGVTLGLARLLAPILPKKFHVNPAPTIAAALLQAVLESAPGCHYRYAESMI